MISYITCCHACVLFNQNERSMYKSSSYMYNEPTDSKTLNTWTLIMCDLETLCHNQNKISIQTLNQWINIL